MKWCRGLLCCVGWNFEHRPAGLGSIDYELRAVVHHRGRHIGALCNRCAHHPGPAPWQLVALWRCVWLSPWSICGSPTTGTRVGVYFLLRATCVVGREVCLSDTCTFFLFFSSFNYITFSFSDPPVIAPTCSTTRVHVKWCMDTQQDICSTFIYTLQLIDLGETQIVMPVMVREMERQKESGIRWGWEGNDFEQDLNGGFVTEASPFSKKDGSSDKTTKIFWEKYVGHAPCPLLNWITSQNLR